MMKRLGAILLTLALVAAACGDDNGARPDHYGCLLSADVVRVDPGLADGDLPSAADLGVDSIEVLTPEELASRLGLGNAAQGAIDAAVSQHTYVEVEFSGLVTHDAVSRVVEGLAAQGGMAVYAATFEGHWGLEPGGEAYISLDNPDTALENDFQVLKAAYDQSRVDGPLVGVVDSGFPFDTYRGLDVGLAAEDAEDESPSHGSFVASNIRKLAPNAEVHGVKSGVVGRTFVGEAGQVLTKVKDVGENSMQFEDEATNAIVVLTDEAAVDIAIRRLHFKANGEPGYLNLSLGTYGCSQGSGIAPPQIIEGTLGIMTGWDIFAAAGNDLGPISHQTDGSESETFYPAGFAEVAGVGSLDEDGMVTLWDDRGGRVVQAKTETSNVGSFDTYARGADVIGVGEDDLGVWSGSSFATAVAVGMSAAAGEPGVPLNESVVASDAARCPKGLWIRTANAAVTRCQ